MLPALVAVLLSCVTGCSHDLSSAVMPDAEIARPAVYFVRQSPKDDSGIAEFIARDLRHRGNEATIGMGEPDRPDVQVLVVYEDRWMWDMSPYLLTLRIDFREPDTNVLLATGKSYRTSLIRKTPVMMVREVIAAIFQDP